MGANIEAENGSEYFQAAISAIAAIARRILAATAAIAAIAQREEYLQQQRSAKRKKAETLCSGETQSLSCPYTFSGLSDAV